MKYAVARIKGHQYKIAEGEELLVSKFGEEKELKPEVLLYVNEEKVTIGKPVVDKVSLKFKKLADEKGEKINGLKYKAKSRYRKRFGFRASYSRIKVEKIVA